VVRGCELVRNGCNFYLLAEALNHDHNISVAPLAEGERATQKKKNLYHMVSQAVV
jgi:hypothetical protein